MRNQLLRFAAFLITAALLIWLIRNADLRNLTQQLLSIDPLKLALALVLFMLSYLLRAARVFDEFRYETGSKDRISSFASLHFVHFLRLTLIHNALVNVVPLRAGEIAFPVLLKRWFDVPAQRSVVALLWLRVQDALVVLALAALVWPGLAIGLRAAAIGAVLLMAWAIPAWMRRHRTEASGTGRIAKIKAALAQSTRSNMRSWLWTLANWSVKITAAASLLAGLLQITTSVAALGALGGELAAILPVQGVAGFGTYEAGVAALMRTYNVSMTAGLQAALILHLIMLGCALLAGGLAAALLPSAPKATAAL